MGTPVASMVVVHVVSHVVVCRSGGCSDVEISPANQDSLGTVRQCHAASGVPV